MTVYPDDDVDADMLLRHADQAMYASNEAGKNAYTIFDLKSHFNRKERVRVLEQIGRALSNNELELYYQPKIDFKRRVVGGFEALIRWNHPEDGLLGPASFLDHIEYTEYARTVGNLVINEAVDRLLAFASEGLEYTISVNLSPSHFLGQSFMEDLTNAVQRLPVVIRHRLILELLETTAMDDTQVVMKTLTDCRYLSVELALDDFGTGYSSLDYFRKLPVHEIKIDRSFVNDMMADSDAESVVNAILGLSRSFGRRVVAEGIETDGMHQRLVALGCDLGQGFYYARPMPFDDAMTWAGRFSWPAQS